MAVETKTNGSPQRWWFDSYTHKEYTASPKRTPWLQSTLSELDEKTKAMLNIIEQDADSFAQRAEMYYKKRPELISMVEDFYRAQRSLAEQYDQVKPDARFRLSTPWASPSPLSSKCRKEKMSVMPCTEISYDSYSETYEPVESEESEVDDPEPEGEEENEDEEEVSSEFVNGPVMKREFVNGEVMKLREEIERLKEERKIQKEEIAEKDEEKREVIRQLSLVMDNGEVMKREFVNGEVMKLREEIERLKEENKIQKEEIAEKDEEKREVIRQLSLVMDVLREENLKLKKSIARESPKKRSPHSDFHKFMGKLFHGSAK